MGDFFTPKRKDVVDKLRRRLELYRHHHSATVGRYLVARPSIYEQQKQDTLLLRQRCLDNKAKKASKQSKSNRDSTQNDHRNLVVTKLKRKIDSISVEANTSSSATSTTTTAPETLFNFDDKDLHSSGIKSSKTSTSYSSGCGNTGSKLSSALPSLSVQIVQQISSHTQQDTSQTIHTNVTVSSHFGSDSPTVGSTSHSVHTSVQCKQEPSEDCLQSSASAPSLHNSHGDPPPSGDIGIGIDDVDELQDILNSIEKEEDIESSLLKELNEFNEIYDKVQRDSESNESANMYGTLACGSPGLSKGIFPNIGPGGHLSNMFDGNQNMSSIGIANHTIPVSSTIPEPTGPAAETLKQMAAQHQHQHSPGYPMKGMDHFTDGLCNGGFSPNYSQLYHSISNTASQFPYNHMTNHHLGDSAQMTPEMAAAMGYGATKPLTHFSNDQQHNSPSSLQQLQNQVQSHFKPTAAVAAASPHQMQIMQTQHMQVTHGAHSLQLTQSQQIQMQPSPQQMSLSQQQNFNMGQQQMVSEQMKMQMMEKMRADQQQQQQNNQGRMPPHYMGRPPPDYKMHHSARPQGPYNSNTASNNNQNPLQTMQNMVNQTSAYGNVKSEVLSAPSPGQANGGMISSQISAMQQQSMSATISSSGSHIGSQSPQGIRPGFHSQPHMQQQPPAYSAVESSTCSQSSSTYSSSTLRNQRPPNVNVGPDGLNISQPRGHSDWPQTTMLQSGVRPVLPSGVPNPHGMTQPASMSAHVMQYHHQRPPHYGAGPNTGSMAQIQQQQQQLRKPMSSQMRGGPSSGIMPSGSQIMMQHQSMQVTQQMSIHPSNSGYIGVSSPGATNVPSSGYNMGGPPTGVQVHSNTSSNQQPSTTQAAAFSGSSMSPQNQDQFLHFLDNPLSNQPMFDSLQNTTDEFSLFDDILNGK